MATETNAVTTTPVSTADLTAMMQAAGFIEEPGTQRSLRIKINGATFEIGDEVYPYNAKKDTPAFVARIVEPLIEYQGFFIDAQHAQMLGRPNMVDKFCKSYFAEPQQARKYAMDGTSCETCPVGPFVKDPLLGKKCQWKADLKLNIIGESGKLTGDEPIAWLTLPTTSVIDFKGTARAPEKGSLSELNFMHKLARLATQDAEQPEVALRKALLSYQMGGIVAEFRLPTMTSADGSRSWPVVVVTPIMIVDVESTPALAAANNPQADPATGEIYDDLPF